MEEGGKIRLSNNICKDHLATTKCSFKTREENNKQQWLICGFNGFGQFKFKNKRKLQQFEDFQITLNDNNADTIVVCSWNCLAIANGCSLLLQGFISNATENVKSIKTKIPIKSIDICDKYCLVLLENGKVYKLTPESDYEFKEITFQTNIKAITSQKRNIFGDYKSATLNMEIDHIASGNNITVAVSKTNAVFSGTTQIHQFPKHERVKQLQCGFEHALLLTTNGDIYAWGNGLRGQLGFEILRVEEIPTLIEALAGVKITYVAAGGWHSAAVSAFGDLYTWGFNSNGQLGLRLYKNHTQTLKEPTVYPLPQLIDLPKCRFCTNALEAEDSLETCLPLKVAAGGRHTVLQMNCGSIFASGWNLYGQLGLTLSQEFCDSFHQCVLKLEKNNNVKDKQIICGDWCTLIKK